VHSVYLFVRTFVRSLTFQRLSHVNIDIVVDSACVHLRHSARCPSYLRHLHPAAAIYLQLLALALLALASILTLLPIAAAVAIIVALIAPLAPPPLLPKTGI